jgi:uncharacterized protein YbaP (TraB family)
MRRWLAVGALVLATACGGTAQTCPVAPAIAADAPPLLWRVQRAGGDGPTLWLYGTIHHAGLGGVPAGALRALDEAPVFASELGDTEPDADVLRRWGRSRGKGLDQRLPMNDWFDLRDLLRPSIKEPELARARPWVAMSLLTSQLSSAPKPSMDFALAARARDRGKPVDALETWEAQLRVIDASVTDDDLLEALHARGTMRCDLVHIRDVYAAGDAATLDRLLRGKNAAALLTDRNRAWMPQLERYLAAEGAFVAVGVAHLTNDADGLPAMLTAAGYVVTRAQP